MKKKPNYYFATFSLFVSLVLLPLSSIANPFSNDIILEIKDRNNQLTLGLAKDHLFLLISEDLRQIYNTEIENSERKEWHTFTDSGGNYIPGGHSYFETDYIEIPLSEIKNITLKGDALELTFNSNSSSTFKNILFDLGPNFFSTFEKHDLAAFSSAYQNNR